MEKTSLNVDQSNPKELIDNSESLETKNGRYEIFYNSHFGKPTNPEKLDTKDALVMELMGITAIKDAKSAGKQLEVALKKYSGTREVLKTAINKGIPIFLADVSLDLASMSRRDFFVSMAGYLEGAIGLKVLFSTQKASGEEKLSRRDFLKKSAGYALGSYLLTPFIQNHALMLADQSKGVREFSRVSDAVHPELRTFFREGRNALIAQKSETIAKILGKDLRRQPEIGILIGSGHYGIKKALEKSEEERIAEIKKGEGVSTKNESLIVRINFGEKNIDGSRPLNVELSNDEAIANA